MKAYLIMPLLPVKTAASKEKQVWEKTISNRQIAPAKAAVLRKKWLLGVSYTLLQGEDVPNAKARLLHSSDSLQRLPPADGPRHA
ncbi:UNVERIFIED_CONTAM: hypothetical protein K2H54_058521 [Gekko kuhli]